MRREADATGEDAARIMCMCFSLHLLCSKIDELVYCDHSAVSVSSCDHSSVDAPQFSEGKKRGKEPNAEISAKAISLKPTSLNKTHLLS